jgi:hypothetical protein
MAWNLHNMPLDERFAFLQYSHLGCYCWEITSTADQHVTVCPAAPENLAEIVRECCARWGRYQFVVSPGDC